MTVRLLEGKCYTLSNMSIYILYLHSCIILPCQDVTCWAVFCFHELHLFPFCSMFCPHVFLGPDVFNRVMLFDAHDLSELILNVLISVCVPRFWLLVCLHYVCARMRGTYVWNHSFTKRACAREGESSFPLILECRFLRLYSHCRYLLMSTTSHGLGFVF